MLNENFFTTLVSVQATIKIEITKRNRWKLEMRG